MSSEKLVYKGKFIQVGEEEIDGLVWEKVYLNDGVIIYPITEEGKIFLIKEKRPHEDKAVRLKFVTGLIDKDEDDPLLTANREHDNRTSSGGIDYNATISDSSRTWLVNKEEIDHIYQKHSEFFVTRKYPDEN